MQSNKHNDYIFIHKFRKDNINLRITKIIGTISIIYTIFELIHLINLSHIIVTLLSILIIITLLTLQITFLIYTKNNRIPDILINNTELIFTKGIFRKKEIILISDIQKVKINKYDEIIEFVTNNNKKNIIHLIPFSKEDKESLIDIFNNFNLKQ